MTNLIGNALDAYNDADNSSEGEIHVTVTNEDDTLSIRVQDFGCGIAPDHHEKIFDDFFSTKPFGEGTGLGLSITRDIITNLFDGTITVESELGHGTTFTLRLPRHGESKVTPPLSLPPQEQHDDDFQDNNLKPSDSVRIPTVMH